MGLPDMRDGKSKFFIFGKFSSVLKASDDARISSLMSLAAVMMISSLVVAWPSCWMVRRNLTTNKVKSIYYLLYSNFIFNILSFNSIPGGIPSISCCIDLWEGSLQHELLSDPHSVFWSDAWAMDMKSPGFQDENLCNPPTSPWCSQVLRIQFQIYWRPVTLTLDFILLQMDNDRCGKQFFLSVS